MATKKNEVLEVEVIITPEALKENESLSEQYNPKTKILTYDISENLPKNLKDELKGILETSQSNEIAALNPAIKTLMELQSFKDLQYDEENKEVSIQSLKDATKAIGAFNSSITQVKSFLKRPHIDYNKKVDTIFNFLKQESDNTKNALKVNFKVHLDEKQKAKEEADRKKKEKELAKIAELTKANKEQEEKLANQKRATRKIEIEAAIGKISFNTNTKAPTSNLEGLKALKTEVNNLELSQLVSEDEGFSDEDYNNFKAMHTLNKEGALRLIDSYIQGIEDKAKLSTLEHEKEVLEAKTPASLIDGDNDTPFSDPKEENVSTGNTDLDKFVKIWELLRDFNEDVDKLITSIKENSFEDKNLTAIQSILIDKSLPQVKEWSGKLEDWTNKKLNIYEEFVKNNSK